MTACRIATIDTELRSHWPFLFVGAGDAAYFEWAEVHVLFQAEPDPRDRALICEAVPPPLGDSLELDGVHLMVASDQFANETIEEIYGEDDDAVGRFNAAIEAWLLEAHERCPILVAFRHEDEEAGGTELSHWHDWSVRQTDRLLPVLEPILARGVDDAMSHAARGVLEMVRDSAVFLPKRVHALLDPGSGIRTALDEGDATALIAEIAGKEDGLEILAEELSARQPRHLRALLGASEALIAAGALPEEITLALVRAAVSPEGRSNREDAKRALDHARARALESKPIADMLAYHAYQAIQHNQWLEAIAQFELVLDSPELDRTAYNNALYAVMADNNKMPVDRARSERFLAAALKFGPENPSIFYNSACVYMELGEVEKTLECLARAIEHGYEEPAKLKEEPMFEPLLSDPRFAALFEDL